MSTIVVVVARPSMIWTLICPVWYLCRSSSSPPWTQSPFLLSSLPFPHAFPRLLCFYCPICWTVQSHLPPLLHLADSYSYDSPEESITFSRKLSLISTFWVRCSPLSSNTILCFPPSMYLSNCNFLNLICHRSLTSELLKLGFSFSSSGFLQCLAHNLTINVC